MTILVLTPNTVASLDTSTTTTHQTSFPLLFGGASINTSKGLTPTSKGSLPLLVKS